MASVCSPFYAEVQLTHISRSLSQRNNMYFQSKEQWHPAEDPINSWRSSSIGRALDRQSRGSGFGSPERHIYRVTVWLKSSTANRGKRMLALLRWSTINLHLTYTHLRLFLHVDFTRYLVDIYSVVSGLDWTGFSLWVISWIGLD